MSVARSSALALTVAALHLPALGCECGMPLYDDAFTLGSSFTYSETTADGEWGDDEGGSFPPPVILDVGADTTDASSDSADSNDTAEETDSNDSGDGDGDGDGGDGDGDGGDGDTGDGDPVCHAPAVYVNCDGPTDALTNDPWQAIGVNCPGDPSQTIPAVTEMISNNPNAWRVASQFGSADGSNPNYDGNPNANGKLWAANPGTWQSPNLDAIPSNTSTAILILSTGVVAPADGQGVVLEPNPQANNNDNGNLDDDGLPPPLSSAFGSNGGQGGTPFMGCDLIHDCSDSLQQWWDGEGWNDPNDELLMRASLTVPPGTSGFVFDFAFFSSEYPDFYDTRFNDQFIAWSTSDAYTGNLTFINDAPLTITSLQDANAFAYVGDAPELADTSFSGNAGTGWFVARGPALPGETFELTFFIADLGDSGRATNVLIDNFRWECAGCIPNEVDSCGIQPPQ